MQEEDLPVIPQKSPTEEDILELLQAFSQAVFVRHIQGTLVDYPLVKLKFAKEGDRNGANSHAKYLSATVGNLVPGLKEHLESWKKELRVGLEEREKKSRLQGALARLGIPIRAEDIIEYSYRLNGQLKAKIEARKEEKQGYIDNIFTKCPKELQRELKKGWEQRGWDVNQGKQVLSLIENCYFATYTLLDGRAPESYYTASMKEMQEDWGKIHNNRERAFFSKEGQNRGVFLAEKEEVNPEKPYFSSLFLREVLSDSKVSLQSLEERWQIPLMVYRKPEEEAGNPLISLIKAIYSLFCYLIKQLTSIFASPLPLEEGVRETVQGVNRILRSWAGKEKERGEATNKWLLY